MIIEHTEAMHVVDVNSGNRSSKDDTQEKNALAVNLEAAEELARVMRLRDMGGIICVDFIDMHSKENNRMLFDKFKEFMRQDRAKHSLVPPSKFGIIEVTRQRVRPVTNIETAEGCPCCNGTGKVQASITFSDEIKEVKSSQLENILDTVSGVTSPKVSGSALLALVVILMPLLTTLDYSVCSCSYNFSII